jgi:xylulokinase
MKKYFIGIDLGTSGVKCGVISQDSTVVASSYWDAELIALKPGSMEQDPTIYHSQTLKIIAEVLTKSGLSSKNIHGVAIDGQMGGVIGIDKSFNPITGLDMGLDTKSERYNEIIHKELGTKLIKTTCGSPRNTPKIMRLKKEQWSLYRRVRKFVTLSGFVTGKMAGINSDRAFIDYTLLSFFGNEDARNLKWSEELTKELDLDIEKFPPVVAPWKIVGTISREASDISGLIEGTPIVAGAGDQPAGFLGAGVVRQGGLLDVCGSSTLLVQSVDKFIPDIEKKSLVYMPSIIKGRYYALSYINGGGICLKWFKDEMLSGSNESDFEQLTDKAAKIPPGSNNLLFIPYFGGRQCPYNSFFRGGWLGLNWGHKKEHLFRSILESLTYDHLLGFKAIQRIFPEIAHKVLLTTGGGSKNRLWNQIKADVLNLPVIPLECYLTPLIGCGILAGYGTGTITNLEAADINTVQEASICYPDKKRNALYKRYAQLFENAFGMSIEKIFEVNQE